MSDTLVILLLALWLIGPVVFVAAMVWLDRRDRRLEREADAVVDSFAAEVRRIRSLPTTREPVR